MKTADIAPGTEYAYVVYGRPGDALLWNPEGGQGAPRLDKVKVVGFKPHGHKGHTITVERLNHLEEVFEVNVRPADIVAPWEKVEEAVAEYNERKDAAAKAALARHEEVTALIGEEAAARVPFLLEEYHRTLVGDLYLKAEKVLTVHGDINDGVCVVVIDNTYGDNSVYTILRDVEGATTNGKDRIIAARHAYNKREAYALAVGHRNADLTARYVLTDA